MSAAEQARGLVAADRRVKRAAKRAFPNGECSYDPEWRAACEALQVAYRRSAVTVARALLRAGPPPESSYTPPILRVGRKVGRTLYMQVGIQPSDRDPLVGVMDTRELASLVASAFADKEERASIVLYALLKGLSYGISLEGCPACDGWSQTAEVSKWETGHSEDCDLRPIEDGITALRQLAYPSLSAAVPESSDEA